MFVYWLLITWTIRICGCKIVSYVFASITCIGSMGQFHFDLLIRKFKYRASNTILFGSPIARKITGFKNVFPLSCCSLLTADIILHCSRMIKSLFTLSRKNIRALLERCFSKIGSGLIRRCSGDCIIST